VVTLRTVGQPRATAAIRSMLATRSPHAVLLAGPQSVGKRSLAADLTAGLLCVGATGAERPCRQCRGCRMVDHGNHPDVHRLDPEGAGAMVGIGGPGRRDHFRAMKAGVVSESSMEMADAAVASPMAMDEEKVARQEGRSKTELDKVADGSGSAAQESSVELRSDFSETAFWEPHIRLSEDGSATVSFEVPDSVTDWNLWVHAVTTDLMGGSASRQAASIKELMVRPYLPRFLREGDRAVLKVVVNNAGEETFTGADAPIEFVWEQDGRALQPDEYYVLFIRHSQGEEYRWVGQQTWYRIPPSMSEDSLTWLIDLADQAGRLWWRVLVVQSRAPQVVGAPGPEDLILTESPERSFRWLR